MVKHTGIAGCRCSSPDMLKSQGLKSRSGRQSILNANVPVPYEQAALLIGCFAAGGARNNHDNALKCIKKKKFFTAVPLSQM